MPKGPQGQKRPGDVIGAAIMVAKIATGEIEDSGADPKARSRGGTARAKSLTEERRKEIAARAAKARWKTNADG